MLTESPITMPAGVVKALGGFSGPGVHTCVAEIFLPPDTGTQIAEYAPVRTHFVSAGQHPCVVADWKNKQTVL